MSRNSMQVADSISTMEDVDERSRWYLKTPLVFEDPVGI